MKASGFLFVCLGLGLVPGGVLGQTNELLRSGTIAQFADTKIFQANGVEVAVGEVNQSFFQESDALAVSLASAEQANGVIEPGWQTSSTFEEWTDRLVLTRTTTYTLIDGAAFQANHVSGEAFVPSQEIVNDPAPAPDMLQLATDFIADDGHLDLYPAARDAGNVGPQALLDELGRDVGPVTFTEVLQFSRRVSGLAHANERPHGVSHLATPPEEGQPLDPRFLEAAPLQFLKVDQFDPVVPDPPEDHSGGIGCYEQSMLNGFSAGFDISWTRKLGKSATFAEVTLFIDYGLGIRIPWRAKVAVEPKLITEVRPDQSPFTSELSIETHDAADAYYVGVGLSSTQILDGQELVLEGGIGIAAKVKVLGATVLDRPLSNPLVGGVVNLSRHFDPPMDGNTVDLIGPILPYELTHMAYNGWLLAIGTDLKVDMGIVGEGFDLNVAPHNAWNALTGGGISKSARTLDVSEENTPGTLPFAVDDDSPKSMTFDGEQFYRHGAVYSGAVYRSDITVTPYARMRGTIKFSAISRFLSDWSLSTPFVKLFNAQFNNPDIPAHSGTESIIEAYHLNRRELGPVPGQTGGGSEPGAPAGTGPGLGTVQHDIAHDGQNTWTVTLNPNCAADVDRLTEVLLPGQTLVPGSIAGGGVYDAATHTVVWDVAGGVPPVMGYQIAGPGSARPKPLATWIARGESEAQVVLPADGGGLTATADALLRRELSQRPTFDEILDGRVGSSLLEVDSQNRVRIELELDTSDDLQTWIAVPESVAGPLTVEFALPAGTRFFRFREK